MIVLGAAEVVPIHPTDRGQKSGDKESCSLALCNWTGSCRKGVAALCSDARRTVNSAELSDPSVFTTSGGLWTVGLTVWRSTMVATKLHANSVSVRPCPSNKCKAQDTAHAEIASCTHLGTTHSAQSRVNLYNSGNVSRHLPCSGRACFCLQGHPKLNLQSMVTWQCRTAQC